MINQRLYTKKAAFRDAKLLVIICGDSKKEPGYFEFFNGISSRIKVRPVPSEGGKSAPNHLLNKAEEESLKPDFRKTDEIWFVIDTDRWRKHINTLRDVCAKKQNWEVAQSNPCFEVWLYFHFKKNLPDIAVVKNCQQWKTLVNNIKKGGFDPAVHPLKIKNAISDSEKNYKETGYFPSIGSTQVFRLGKKMMPFIEKELREIAENTGE